MYLASYEPIIPYLIFWQEVLNFDGLLLLNILAFII